jgi:hypothetical protein
VYFSVFLPAPALPQQPLVAGGAGDHGDPLGHDERAEQPDAELSDQFYRAGAVGGLDPLAQLVGAGPADG